MSDTDLYAGSVLKPPLAERHHFPANLPVGAEFHQWPSEREAALAMSRKIASLEAEVQSLQFENIDLRKRLKRLADLGEGNP